MNSDIVLELFKISLMQAFMLAGPILLITLVVGVVVSIFQTVTSVQEMTLSFVPKAAIICGTLVLAGPWMLQKMTIFTVQILQRLPDFAR